MSNRAKAHLAACAAWLTVACGNPQAPGDEPFSLRMTFVDLHGDPVTDLEIVAFNRVPPGVLPDGASPCDGPPGNHFVTLRFGVYEQSRVQIAVYNWRGEHVRQLIDRSLPVGLHSLVWDRTDDRTQTVANGLYRFHLVALNSASGENVYEKEVFGLAMSPEQALGTTDADGIVETDDELRFPGVLSTPPLQSVGADGTLGDTFELGPNISIVARQTGRRQLQCFEASIVRGPNDFEFVWNPTTLAEDRVRPPEAPEPSGILMIPTPPRVWDLREPAPNPF